MSQSIQSGKMSPSVQAAEMIDQIDRNQQRIHQKAEEITENVDRYAKGRLEEISEYKSGLEANYQDDRLKLEERQLQMKADLKQQQQEKELNIQKHEDDISDLHQQTAKLTSENLRLKQQRDHRQKKEPSRPSMPTQYSSQLNQFQQPYTSPTYVPPIGYGSTSGSATRGATGKPRNTKDDQSCNIQ